jgi:tetratricopeptide (TPR) repeat protein
MKTLYLGIILLLLCSVLIAQYDEKQILYQQAGQYMTMRQYDRAEATYLQILDKYPNDLNSVLQLMQIYLSLNQNEKAENHLNRYQRVLPQSTMSELRIQLLLMQGRPDDADREAETYLSLFPGDLNKHRLLASFYERRSFYDQSIRLYEKARQSSGQAVFALEIANAAMQAQKYQRALQEYLQHMTSVTTSTTTSKTRSRT